MRKITLLAAAICGAFATSGALAQLEKGTTAPDVEAKVWLNTDGETFSLQDTRGMITVLYFWVAFHQGGKFYLEDLNGLDGTFGREQGVRFVGITSGDRKRTEPWLKEHKVFFPVGCESKSDAEYKVQFWPYMVVVDPEGKVAWSGAPAGFDEAYGVIRDIVATNPPTRTHPVAAEEARRSMSVARKALQANPPAYGEAAKAARIAVDKAMAGDPLKTHCQDMIDLLEAVGRDAVAKAEIAVADERWADAVKELRFTMRHFRGLDVFKVAKERLETYKKDHEQIRKELGDLEGAEKARGEIKKARALVEAKKFGPAYEILVKVRDDYDDTPEGDTAKGMLERAEKNPQIMKEIHEFLAAKDCKEWMASARNYIANKRYVEAKKLLRQIIDTYPDSSFADEAVTELVKLP